VCPVLLPVGCDASLLASRRTVYRAGRRVQGKCRRDRSQTIPAAGGWVPGYTAGTKQSLLLLFIVSSKKPGPTPYRCLRSPARRHLDPEAGDGSAER
jgi:hypothetical protein